MERSELITYIRHLKDEDSRRLSRHGISVWSAAAAFFYALHAVITQWPAHQAARIIGWATQMACALFLLWGAVAPNEFKIQLKQPIRAFRFNSLLRYVATSVYMGIVASVALVYGGIDWANAIVLIASGFGLLVLPVLAKLESCGLLIPNFGIERSLRRAWILRVVYAGVGLLSVTRLIIYNPPSASANEFILHVLLLLVVMTVFLYVLFPPKSRQILDEIDRQLVLNDLDKDEARDSLESELFGRHLGLMLSDDLEKIRGFLGKARKVRLAAEEKVRSVPSNAPPQPDGVATCVMKEECKEWNGAITIVLFKVNRFNDYINRLVKDARFDATADLVKNVVARKKEIFVEFKDEYELMDQNVRAQLCGRRSDESRKKCPLSVPTKNGWRQRLLGIPSLFKFIREIEGTSAKRS